MEFKDKVVIITGASSGIGEATAKLFAKKGANIILAARSMQKLEKFAKELPHAYAVQTDMTKESDIRRMVQKTIAHFGKIDILVNNAGRGYHVPLMQIERDKYHELFDLDVVGPLSAMQQVIPYMRKRGKGIIINISSGTSLMAIPGIAAYSSMKRALNAISLTAREELKKDNITVSLVYPYITKTQFHKHLLNETSWKMEENDTLPPFDTPEYVAEKVVEAAVFGKAEVYAHDWMKS